LLFEAKRKETEMFNRLFPRQIDNKYQGYRLAIWILGLIVLLKLIMGLNVSGLNPWVSNVEVLINADGVPLGSFSAEAASTAVYLFASWGFGLFILNLLGMLVLIRYRAMIPLMYLLLLIEQIGRKIIGQLNPIVGALEAEGLSIGALINGSLTAALVIGIMLSLVVTTKNDPECET
jgi:hypothetical protein